MRLEIIEGISLSSIVAKFVNKIILNRIQPKLEPHLRPNHSGFRSGRSTRPDILALRGLIEGIKHHNRKAIILYIDFKKAFFSINRGKMMKILGAYNTPPRMLQAIAKLHEDTKARVISPDGETEYFEIKAGVLQDNTSALYLFAIVLDYVMRKVYEEREHDLGFELHRRRSKRNAEITITDLDFADDLAILTEEVDQAQEMLIRLESEVEKVGLHCNAKKNELQVYNHDLPVNIRVSSGAQLKVVKNFKHLGAWTESTKALA